MTYTNHTARHLYSAFVIPTLLSLAALLLPALGSAQLAWKADINGNTISNIDISGAASYLLQTGVPINAGYGGGGFFNLPGVRDNAVSFSLGGTYCPGTATECASATSSSTPPAYPISVSASNSVQYQKGTDTIATGIEFKPTPDVSSVTFNLYGNNALVSGTVADSQAGTYKLVYTASKTGAANLDLNFQLEFVTAIAVTAVAANTARYSQALTFPPAGNLAFGSADFLTVEVPAGNAPVTQRIKTCYYATKAARDADTFNTCSGGSTSTNITTPANVTVGTATVATSALPTGFSVALPTGVMPVWTADYAEFRLDGAVTNGGYYVVTHTTTDTAVAYDRILQYAVRNSFDSTSSSNLLIELNVIGSEMIWDFSGSNVTEDTLFSLETGADIDTTTPISLPAVLQAAAAVTYTLSGTHNTGAAGAANTTLSLSSGDIMIGSTDSGLNYTAPTGSTAGKISGTAVAAAIGLYDLAFTAADGTTTLALNFNLQILAPAAGVGGNVSFDDSASDIKRAFSSYPAPAGTALNYSLPVAANTTGAITYTLSGTHNTGVPGAADSTLIVDGTTGAITFVDSSNTTVESDLIFSATARTISGTPASDSSGTYSFTYTATDDETLTGDTSDDTFVSIIFDLLVATQLSWRTSGSASTVLVPEGSSFSGLTGYPFNDGRTTPNGLRLPGINLFNQGNIIYTLSGTYCPGTPTACATATSSSTPAKYTLKAQSYNLVGTHLQELLYNLTSSTTQGLGINVSATGTNHALVGTPNAAGTYDFDVSARQGGGASYDYTFQLHLVDHTVLSPVAANTTRYASPLSFAPTDTLTQGVNSYLQVEVPAGDAPVTQSITTCYYADKATRDADTNNLCTTATGGTTSGANITAHTTATVGATANTDFTGILTSGSTDITLPINLIPVWTAGYSEFRISGSVPLANRGYYVITHTTTDTPVATDTDSALLQSHTETASSSSLDIELQIVVADLAWNETNAEIKPTDSSYVLLTGTNSALDYSGNGNVALPKTSDETGVTYTLSGTYCPGTPAACTSATSSTTPPAFTLVSRTADPASEGSGVLSYTNSSNVSVATGMTYGYVSSKHIMAGTPAAASEGTYDFTITASKTGTQDLTYDFQFHLVKPITVTAVTANTTAYATPLSFNSGIDLIQGSDNFLKVEVPAGNTPVTQSITTCYYADKATRDADTADACTTATGGTTSGANIAAHTTATVDSTANTDITGILPSGSTDITLPTGITPVWTADYAEFQLDSSVTNAGYYVITHTTADTAIGNDATLQSQASADAISSDSLDIELNILPPFAFDDSTSGIKLATSSYTASLGTALDYSLPIADTGTTTGNVTYTLTGTHNTGASGATDTTLSLSSGSIMIGTGASAIDSDLDYTAPVGATLGKIAGTPAAAAEGTFTFTFTATDDGSSSVATTTFSLSILPLVAFDDSASDIKLATSSYTANSGTALAYDLPIADTGTTTGTVTYELTGTHNTGSSGATNTTLSLSSGSIMIGTGASAIDSDLDYTAPVGTTLGTIAGTPAAAVEGTFTFTFTATDDGSNSVATTTFSLSIIPPFAFDDSASDIKLATSSYTANSGTALAYDLPIADADTTTGTVTYELTGTHNTGASGATNTTLSLSSGSIMIGTGASAIDSDLDYTAPVGTTLGTIAGTPAAAVEGTLTLTFTATDDGSSSVATTTFSLSILPPFAFDDSASDIKLATSSYTTNSGTALDFSLPIADADTTAGTVTYTLAGTHNTGASGATDTTLSLSSGSIMIGSTDSDLDYTAPSGATLGKIAGTPAAAAEGTLTLTFTATDDGSGSVATTTFSLNILPPFAFDDSTSGIKLATSSYTADSGTALAYSLPIADAGTTTGTVTYTLAGTHNTGASGATDTTLSLSSGSIMIGSTDSELDYTAPSGTTLGTITGTPAAAAEGTFTLTFTATDDGSGSVSVTSFSLTTTFNLVVNAAAVPFAFDDSASTVKLATSDYSEPAGTAINYSLPIASNATGGVSYGLSGTHTALDGTETELDLTGGNISIGDGGTDSALDYTAPSGNNAGTIAGTPAAAAFGTYALVFTATDDNETLTLNFNLHVLEVLTWTLDNSVKLTLGYTGFYRLLTGTSLNDGNGRIGLPGIAGNNTGVTFAIPATYCPDTPDACASSNGPTDTPPTYTLTRTGGANKNFEFNDGTKTIDTSVYLHDSDPALPNLRGRFSHQAPGTYDFTLTASRALAADLTFDFQFHVATRITVTAIPANTTRYAVPHAFNPTQTLTLGGEDYLKVAVPTGNAPIIQTIKTCRYDTAALRTAGNANCMGGSASTNITTHTSATVGGVASTALPAGFSITLPTGVTPIWTADYSEFRLTGSVTNAGFYTITHTTTDTVVLHNQNSEGVSVVLNNFKRDLDMASSVSLNIELDIVNTMVWDFSATDALPAASLSLEQNSAIDATNTPIRLPGVRNAASGTTPTYTLSGTYTARDATNAETSTTAAIFNSSGTTPINSSGAIHYGSTDSGLDYTAPSGSSRGSITGTPNTNATFALTFTASDGTTSLSMAFTLVVLADLILEKNTANNIYTDSGGTRNPIRTSTRVGIIGSGGALIAAPTGGNGALVHTVTTCYYASESLVPALNPGDCPLQDSPRVYSAVDFSFDIERALLSTTGSSVVIPFDQHVGSSDATFRDISLLGATQNKGVYVITRKTQDTPIPTPFQADDMADSAPDLVIRIVSTPIQFRYQSGAYQPPTMGTIDTYTLAAGSSLNREFPLATSASSDNLVTKLTGKHTSRSGTETLELSIDQSGGRIMIGAIDSGINYVPTSNLRDNNAAKITGTPTAAGAGTYTFTWSIFDDINSPSDLTDDDTISQDFGLIVTSDDVGFDDSDSDVTLAGGSYSEPSGGTLDYSLPLADGDTATGAVTYGLTGTHNTGVMGATDSELSLSSGSILIGTGASAPDSGLDYTAPSGADAGKIAGTLSAAAAGTFTFTFTATDDEGTSTDASDDSVATTTFTLSVVQGLAWNNTGSDIATDGTGQYTLLTGYALDTGGTSELALPTVSATGATYALTGSYCTGAPTACASSSTSSHTPPTYALTPNSSGELQFNDGATRGTGITYANGKLTGTPSVSVTGTYDFIYTASKTGQSDVSFAFQFHIVTAVAVAEIADNNNRYASALSFAPGGALGLDSATSLKVEVPPGNAPVTQTTTVCYYANKAARDADSTNTCADTSTGISAHTSATVDGVASTALPTGFSIKLPNGITPSWTAGYTEMHLSGDVDAASYYVITHTTTDTAVGNDTDLQLMVPADAATMASLDIELDITSSMIWSFSGSNVTDSGSFTLAEDVAVSEALTLPVATGDSVSANVMYELTGTFTARDATNAESGSASNVVAISTDGPINYGSSVDSGFDFTAPTSSTAGTITGTPTDNGTFVFTYTATDTPNEISTTFTLVVLTDLTPTANTAANEALYGTAGATALDFAPGATVSNLLIYGPTGGNGTLSHSLTTCYYATESDVPSMNPGQCDNQTSSNTAAQATYVDGSATRPLPANVSLTLPLGLSARFDGNDFTNATLEGSITNGGFYYLSYSAADTPIDNSFQTDDVANTTTSLTVQINVAAFRFVDSASDIKTGTDSYTLKAGAGIDSGSISLPAVAGASGSVSYGLSGTHNTGATLDVDGTSGVITYEDSSSMTVSTGLTFSATARTITGTPAVAGVGTYSLSYTATDDNVTLTDTFDLVVVEDLAVAFSGTTDSTYGSSNPISLTLTSSLSQGSDTYLSIAVPKGNGVSPQVITTCYYATEAGRTAATDRIGCANHDTNTNTADVPTATVGANTGQSLPAGFKARLPAGVALTWTDLTYSAMRLSGMPTGAGFYAITVSVSDVAIGNSFQTADDANTDTLEIFLNVTSSLSFNYTGSNVIDGNLYELEAGTALTTSITLPIPSTPVTPMFALSGTHTSTSGTDTALSLDSSNNIRIGTSGTTVDSGLDYSPLVLTAANARDGTTGTISGTPSSAAAALGSYALTFTYTESGTPITADFTLNVIADITAPALPSGSQNPTLYGASYGTVVSFDPGESLRQVISGTTNNYLLIDAPVGNQPFSTMAISTCYYATEADRNADSSNACSAAINSTNIRSHSFATVGMRSNQPLPGTGSSVTLPAGVTLAFTDNSYEQIQLGGAATHGGHYVINFSVSDSAIDNSLLQGAGTPRTGDTSDSASFAIELAILDPMFDYSASPISDGGQITLEQNVALTSPLILPTANSVFANSTYTLAGTIDVANNGANHHGSGTDLALSQTPGLLTYSGSTSTGLTYVAPTAAAAGRITGTPIAGIYKFTYRVVDNKGTASETADDDSETAAFTLNVLHDLPLAQNPSAVTAYASALDIEFGEPLVQGSNAYLEVSPPGEDQLTSGQYSGGLRPLTQAFSTCYYADAAAQTADSAGTACTNFGTVQQRGQVDASNTAIDLPPGFSARMPNGVQVRWVYDSTSRTWGNARISGTARFEGLYVITYTVTGTSFDTSLQSGAAATARTSTLSIELNIQRDDAPQLSIDDVVREGGTYYYVPNSPLNLELPLASGGEGAILEELTTTCLQPDGSTACAGTQVESQTLSNALGSSASSVPVGVTLSAFQNGSRTRLTGTPTGSGTAVGSYTIVYQIGDSDSNTASCSASGADPETCDTSSVTFTLRPIKLIDADILGTPHITLLTGTALSTAIKLPRADITSVPTATVSYSLSGSADIGDGVIRPIADGELVDDDGSVYALQKVFGVIGTLPTDLTYTETTNSVSGTISGTPDSAVAGTTMYLQYSINHDGGTAGDTSDDFSFSLDLDLTFIADQTVSLAAARMEELDAESLFYFAGEPLSADVNVPFVLPNADSTGNGALSDALVTCYYANRAAKDADSAGTACSTSSSNLQSGLGNSSPVGITVTNKTGVHPANLTGSVTNPGYYQLTYTISDTAIANTAAYQTADTADSASTTFYLDVRADVPPTLTLSDAETIAVQGSTTVLLTKEDTLQTVDIALPVAAGGNLSLIEQLDTICVNSTTDLARCNSAAVDRTQRQTPTVLSAGAVRALADSTLDYTVNVPRGLTFIPRTGSTAARLTGAIEVSGIYTVTYRVIDNDHNTLACTEISPAYNLGGEHKYEPAQCDTAYISFTLDVQAMLRPTFVTTEESMNLRLPPAKQKPATARGHWHQRRPHLQPERHL